MKKISIITFLLKSLNKKPCEILFLMFSYAKFLNQAIMLSSIER